MVLKIKKKNPSGESVQYKSSKIILTPRDIKKADAFDDDLDDEVIQKLEKKLVKLKIVDQKSKKKDPLKAWYIIGKYINKFLQHHSVEREDENSFWNEFYGRSKIIHIGIPSKRIGQTRNDFRTASLLARFPFDKLRKTGSWALWREIITYKSFIEDERVLEWVVNRLIDSPRTRDKARPFLKAVAARLKRIDTSILDDKELLSKLETIK